MTLSMRGIIRLYILISLTEKISFSRSPGWRAWLNLKLKMCVYCDVTSVKCRRWHFQLPFAGNVEASLFKHVYLCTPMGWLILGDYCNHSEPNGAHFCFHSSFHLPSSPLSLLYSSVTDSSHGKHPLIWAVSLKTAVSWLEGKEQI